MFTVKCPNCGYSGRNLSTCPSGIRKLGSPVYLKFCKNCNYEIVTRSWLNIPDYIANILLVVIIAAWFSGYLALMHSIYTWISIIVLLILVPNFLIKRYEVGTHKYNPESGDYTKIDQLSTIISGQSGASNSSRQRVLSI